MAQHPFYANLYALVIGIDTYRDARFRPLGEAEKDARLMQQALKGRGFKIASLMGKKATRQSVSTKLAELVKVTQENDLVLVYYSGHGAPFDQTACIVPYDADQDELLSVITLDQLTFQCQQAKARHVGFVFDACFSALVMGVVEKPKSSDPASKLLERRTYMALSAAAGLADDVQSMTRFVLAEMDQGAPDETTGLFTFSDLCYRVRKQMLVEVGKKQIPQFGHLPRSEGGDIILAADVGLRLPASLLANLHSEEWYMRLGAVTSLIEIAKSLSLIHI